MTFLFEGHFIMPAYREKNNGKNFKICMKFLQQTKKIWCFFFFAIYFRDMVYQSTLLDDEQ